MADFVMILSADFSLFDGRWLRIMAGKWLVFILMALAAPGLAQDYPVISADNLDRLASVKRIDFADWPADISIGWFEPNSAATEFVLFDSDASIHIAAESGRMQSQSYAGGQVFALIDAVYLDGAPFALYLLDGQPFINGRRLTTAHRPAGIFRRPDSDLLYIEAINDRGDAFFEVYPNMAADENVWRPLGSIPHPLNRYAKPALKIGRVDFPVVIASAAAPPSLLVMMYPHSFTIKRGREYQLEQGPAVFGAVNRRATHFAWIDPHSTWLNLLDLHTGENQRVAALQGAYAQYYLLTHNADAVIAVHSDFEPKVVGWHVRTGERFDLGRYRACQRIPDKATLSEDGAALMIGCDSGLDIWRVVDEAD